MFRYVSTSRNLLKNCRTSVHNVKLSCENKARRNLKVSSIHLYDTGKVLSTNSAIKRTRSLAQRRTKPRISSLVFEQLIGAVASWLVCSTPNRAVLVRVLAGDVYCVAFLGKTLYSYSASLQPGL